MISRFAATALLVLVLALGACGDDSPRQDGASSGATSGEGATDGVATTEPQGDEGDLQKLDPEQNQQPVPEGSTPPEERTDAPPRYTPKNPIPKDQLKAVERPIFEQSRYLCGRLGVEGMKREYRLDTSDPEEVARAVAERTYQRQARAAVYSGCLAGLRSGG